MRRQITLLLVILGTLVFGVVVTLPGINFFLLTGRFSPIVMIESLQQPVAVSSWNSDGFHLADGRTVQLPGFQSLPIDSVALTEATKRGIEVQEDGRVWGLVQVHHWCGNDPVRTHITRVDLSDMLMFLRVGETTAEIPEAEYLAHEPGGRFNDEFGWRVGEFYEFERWQSLKDSEL